MLVGKVLKEVLVENSSQIELDSGTRELGEGPCLCWDYLIILYISRIF